jgi:hypothetical protein
LGGSADIFHSDVLDPRSPPRLSQALPPVSQKRVADRSEIITTTHLEKSLEPYSQERLQDIINEFKSELPDIQKFLLDLRPSKKQRSTSESFQFTTDQLRSKINNSLQHVNLHFTNNRPISSGSLIQFLYKIDFITARILAGDGSIDRKYF